MSMADAQMIRKLGALWAFFFVLGGVLGFVPGITKGDMFLGVFMVNTPHNILHLISGVVFLIASLIGAGAARGWFLIFGTFYAGLSAVGFVVGDGMILHLISNNNVDSWGHALLALILLAIGVVNPKGASQPIDRPHESEVAAPVRSAVTRYHPVLVTLHWIIAVIIFVPLLVGQFVLARLPNTDPLIFHGLRAHMGVGMLIGVLMLSRLLVRMGTKRPIRASTGSKWLDQMARVSHGLLYFAVLGQVASGLFLTRQAQLLGPVLAGRGALPSDFSAYPAFFVHYLFSRLLIVLLVLHVSGVVYHRIVLRDRLLSRMSFGGPKGERRRS